MKLHTIFSTVVPLLLVQISFVYGDRIAKRYSVNLDQPPEERWQVLLKNFNTSNFRELVREVATEYVPKDVVPLIDIIVDPLEEYVPQPYAGEIRGIAKTVGLGVGELLLLNILYDVTAFCTSIVAQNRDGTLFHGRNMDYPLKKQLVNLTMEVDFIKNGKTEYTTTSFLGQVGVFTGMRPYVMTASINQRDKGRIEDNLRNLVDSLLKKEGTLTTFIIRDVLESATSYRDAVEKFTLTQLVAPVYIILGGMEKEEGVIITKGTGEADLYELVSYHHRWYVLETNYDHWTQPPKDDDRRDAGMSYMKKVGPERISKESMLNEVLSLKPIINNITVYTTLMSAKYPAIYETVVRN